MFGETNNQNMDFHKKAGFNSKTKFSSKDKTMNRKFKLKNQKPCSKSNDPIEAAGMTVYILL